MVTPTARGTGSIPGWGTKILHVMWWKKKGREGGREGRSEGERGWGRKGRGGKEGGRKKEGTKKGRKEGGRKERKKERRRKERKWESPLYELKTIENVCTCPYPTIHKLLPPRGLERTHNQCEKTGSGPVHMIAYVSFTVPVCPGVGHPPLASGNFS